MALKDDLLGRESYYLAEIRSLKRILDETGEEYPVLCFVDEVLRGTNTVERIAASAQILESLSGRNVICFAATHDIELTYILEDDYENYHVNVDDGHINVDNNVSTTVTNTVKTTVTNKPSVSLDEPINVRVTNIP